MTDKYMEIAQDAKAHRDVLVKMVRDYNKKQKKNSLQNVTLEIFYPCLERAREIREKQKWETAFRFKPNSSTTKAVKVGQLLKDIDKKNTKSLTSVATLLHGLHLQFKDEILDKYLEKVGVNSNQLPPLDLDSPALSETNQTASEHGLFGGYWSVSGIDFGLSKVPVNTSWNALNNPASTIQEATWSSNSSSLAHENLPSGKHFNQQHDYSEFENDANWLDPRNHKAIKLTHRDAEIGKLNKFLEKDAPFLVCPIIGPSGSGKTRLVRQWIVDHVIKSKDWLAGFALTRNPDVWTGWSPRRNTLIAIDYSFHFSAVLAAIAEKRNEVKGCKIRVIILDHILPIVPSEDPLYRQGFPDFKVMSADNPLLQAPINLSSSKERRALLRSVIAQRSNLPETSPLIEAGLEALRRMDRHAVPFRGESSVGVKDMGPSQHPLFAALIGEQIRTYSQRGMPLRFDHENRRDLIQNYLDRENRLPWKFHDEKQKCRYGFWVGAYVSVSTLYRGTPIDVLHETLVQHQTLARATLGETSQHNLDEIANWSSRIVASNDTEILKPFEPDIIGESFFLLFFHQFRRDPVALQVFIKFLSGIEKRDQSNQTLLNFVQTIQRLIGNIANDDPATGQTKLHWKSLRAFLDPGILPVDSALRPAVAVLRAHFDKSSNSLYAERHKINTNDPVELNNYLHFFRIVTERLNNHDKLSPRPWKHHDLWNTTAGVIGQLLEAEAGKRHSEPIFGKTYFREWSKLIVSREHNLVHIAAAHGLPLILKYALEHDEKSIKYKVDNYITPLGVACLNSKLATMLVLLRLEERIDKFWRDDEWNAFLAARKSGNENAVTLLLHHKSPDGAGVGGFALVSPLMVLARWGLKKSKDLLICNFKDENITKRDHFGYNASMWAKVFGNDDFADEINVKIKEITGGPVVSVCRQEFRSSPSFFETFPPIDFGEWQYASVEEADYFLKFMQDSEFIFALDDKFVIGLRHCRPSFFAETICFEIITVDRHCLDMNQVDRIFKSAYFLLKTIRWCGRMVAWKLLWRPTLYFS